jgi:hypothetical protein
LQSPAFSVTSLVYPAVIVIVLDEDVSVVVVSSLVVDPWLALTLLATSSLPCVIAEETSLVSEASVLEPSLVLSQ